MSRPVLVVLVLVVLASSGCTSESTDPPGRTPDPSGGTAPTTPGTEPGRPETTEPLLLVTAASGPVLRLSLDEARELLAGTDRARRVIHAPGTPQVQGIQVRDARAVLRQVRRRPRTLGVLPAGLADPTVRPAIVAGVHPLRRPAAYPLQVPGPAPEQVTRLTVVGDVMLARRVPDPAAALAPMRQRLARADLTVGTLESTLSDAGRPQQGGDSFAADPSVLPLLEEAGFDAVSLANNHVGDFEVPAMLETIRLLRSSAVAPFGAGRDRRAAGRPAVLEHGGIRFGLVGFNAIGETPRATPGSPGALSVRMPPRTGPFVEADLAHVERVVRRLADRVDVVVVLPHWGTQYTHVAEPIQHTVSRRLARAGADLVVGGHPHWVQGLDRIGETLVAHSLGNFVFDMDFMTETQQGVVLETTWWGSQLKGFDLVPYRMDGRFAPRVARGDEAAGILGDVWSHSHGPFTPR